MTDAEERDGSDPIVEAKLTGGVLRIPTKEENSHETLQSEMKLTGIDQAAIRILLPPEESVRLEARAIAPIHVAFRAC
jgi:hypothetical protein